MPEKLPLVLDDSAQLEQIQTGDALDPDATGLVSRREFDQLCERHDLLVNFLIESGIPLPEEDLLTNS